MSHELAAFLSDFEMGIWSKEGKPDNFKSHNALKFSFTNTRGLLSNFAGCNLSLNQTHWHPCSIWDKLGWLDWLWPFLCVRLSSFNPKGFCYLYSYSLCKGRTSFCMVLISRKLCRSLFLFLAGFTSLSYFFSSIDYVLCQFNIDEVFLIKASANAFVFGDLPS